MASHEGLCWWIARRGCRGRTEQDVEDAAAEARAQLIRAAATYDPGKGANFRTYALRFARQRVRRFVRRLSARGVKVPADGPYAPPVVWSLDRPFRDGDKRPDPADHRRAEVGPALKLWCSPDYSEQRKCLDWRSRVVLYLRAVEGWTLEECVVLGVTRERVRQLEDRAVSKLAAWRNRRLVRRQLAGRA